MENVIWVDEQDNVLGNVPIEKAHRESLLHRIVVVYLVRKNRDILVQERMSGRLDHSSAGHVDLGEEYITAAKRELKEELGIECDLTEIGKTHSSDVEPEVGNQKTRHLFTVYVCTAEPKVLAKGEVKNVFWTNPHEVLKDMEKDPKNEKYCGGFKASLKFYLQKIQK